MRPWVPPSTLKKLQKKKEISPCAGEAAEVVECLHGVHKPWAPSLPSRKLSVILHTCHPSTQEVEAGGSETPGYSMLYSK